MLTSLFMSIVGAPMFSLFLIGGAFPFVGCLAAMSGSLTSLAVVLWISVGRLMFGNTWEKPVAIDNSCPNSNMTSSQSFLYVEYNNNNTYFTSTPNPAAMDDSSTGVTGTVDSYSCWDLPHRNGHHIERVAQAETERAEFQLGYLTKEFGVVILSV